MVRSNNEAVEAFIFSMLFPYIIAGGMLFFLVLDDEHFGYSADIPALGHTWDSETVSILQISGLFPSSTCFHVVPASGPYVPANMVWNLSRIETKPCKKHNSNDWLLSVFYKDHTILNNIPLFGMLLLISFSVSLVCIIVLSILMALEHEILSSIIFATQAIFVCACTSKALSLWYLMNPVIETSINDFFPKELELHRTDYTKLKLFFVAITFGLYGIITICGLVYNLYKEFLPHSNGYRPVAMTNINNP